MESLVVDFITCSICLEELNELKELTCAYSFCKICLQNLSSASATSELVCPLCRTKKTRTIDNLPPGFKVNSLKGIHKKSSNHNDILKSKKFTLFHGIQSFEELIAGDHIYIYQGLFTHHGIYVGERKVIQCVIKGKESEVIESSLEEFAEKSFYIFNI